jgi:preprotein translocase subunit Sec61beta
MAMIIAALIAGLVAYFVSCKIRRKIILTTVLAISMAIAYMMIHTNIILTTKDYTMIELMALGLGATGVYFLLLGVLLIPLSLLSWFLTHLIRNLKEQKDPLLMLEGRCDL